MWMLKLTLILLCCCGGLGVAQDAPPAEKGAEWVVWVDGYRYVPEWKAALEAVTSAMKPGESCDVYAFGLRLRFVRSEGESALNDLDSRLKEILESGGRNMVQLSEEMRQNSYYLDNAGIRSYINSRKQLLGLYERGHQLFWKTLDGIVPAPGSRLVVLVQQFDVPGISRSALSGAGEWSLELSDCSPWEEKTKNIKRIAEKLKTQNSRVDGFYLKTRGRTSRDDFEVSKALFSGVSRLCKTSGGYSGNLDADGKEIVSQLNGSGK